jgi:DNA-binding NtrC family response regulator
LWRFNTMQETLTLASRRPAELGRTMERAVELAGQSLAIGRVNELLRHASASESPVLLVAEQGADVASVARELHDRSRQPGAPFIGVDCTHEPVRLDSLLFGAPSIEGEVHLEAVAPDSRIAAARGGTLFLQDVGELPASVQAKLARVVRDREASIDGQPVTMTFRLIASATPGIDGDAYARRFRVDLYRRLSSCRIDLPPLRNRPEDVPALATRLLEDVCDAQHVPPRGFTQAAVALLSALSWPGNLSQLQRVIERVVAEVTSEVIQVEHLLPALQLDRAPAPFVPAGNLREARLRFERDYIAAVLQHHGWRMADAAKTLGIQRPNLYRKARQLGIMLTRIADQ